MDRVLDFSVPLDVNLLDSVVETFYNGSGQPRLEAQRVVQQFTQDPRAWRTADNILTNSRSQSTKFLALSMLDSTIKYQWKALSREECIAIRNFILKTVMDVAASEGSLTTQKLYVNKLNETLVQIIKQEWPANWPNLVQEIVQSSKQSRGVCENNMRILQLLSEEVFDFSSVSMTTEKARVLKETFNSQFEDVFKLCLTILTTPQDKDLLTATLNTLLRFLTWLPPAYLMIDTPLVPTLATAYLAEPVFRNLAIQCLTEIASVDPPGAQHEAVFVASSRNLLLTVVKTLQAFFPVNADLSQLFKRAEYENEQNFVKYLTLFFSTIFQHHLSRLECPELAEACKIGHQYMLLFSQVQDDVIFKICVEYWKFLTNNLYNEIASRQPQVPQPAAGASPLLLNPQQAVDPTAVNYRCQFYTPILSQLRSIMISRFAKPEEVLITEENGEVVREVVKNTEVTDLYKLMREVLVFLTHLDYTDTQTIMLAKLSAQVNADGTTASRAELNSLSWAIGSISGAMSEDVESRFVVVVIRDLLNLVAVRRGKDNKAAVAGNLMYVVGQYPRFLRAHWRFLKTVVNKLFEFMHEAHPGVQDMAVDTFLKIAVKCKRKFVTLNPGDTVPFVNLILENLLSVICDLEPQQQNTFYSAMGHIIASQTETTIRDGLVAKLMDPPNIGWDQLTQGIRQPQQAAGSSPIKTVTEFGTLDNTENMKRLVNVLRVNSAAAETLGSGYAPQLGRIYVDMIDIYGRYSRAITAQLSTNNPASGQSVMVRQMRCIKQEILHLIETYIGHSQRQDARTVAQNFVGPLLTVVLPDYQQSPPNARDAQVLSLMTCVIERLQGVMTSQIQTVFKHLFQPTLEMITKNFTDYPDHRARFFEMIQTINTYCFDAFFQLSPPEFKLLMDCVFWALRHTERNVSETGLRTLEELLRQISQHPTVSDGFFQSYYVTILRELFAVFTDTLHKAEFKQHASLFRHLFDVVLTGRIQVPLWDTSKPAPPDCNNTVWLKQFIVSEFTQSFPHVSQAEVVRYVDLFLVPNQPLQTFKQHLRDFLISIKEFSNGGSDNRDLYREENEAAQAQLEANELARRKNVPGLLKPSELPDDMNETE